MTNQPIRTNLELYAKVTDVHLKLDTLVKIRRHRWISGAFVITITLLTFAILACFPRILDGDIKISIISFFFIVLGILLFFCYMKYVADLLTDALCKIRHRGLIRWIGPAWEFYRYVNFRDELSTLKVRRDEVATLKPLLAIEDKTLASLIAQRPFIVWLSTTTGAIVAASATTWDLNMVVMWIVVVVALLIMHYLSPVHISEQRRRYELQRFLTWYEADAPKPATLTPDGVRPSSD